MASKRKSPRRSVRKQSTNKQRSHARHAVLAKRKRPAKSVAAGGRRSLYPAIEPYNSGMLKVSPVHEIYYEECGNPKGKPALFVHGGPGAGCDNRARRFFDPDAYRIVLFDQRGCGRSKPHASLVDNTTWHLVADMEQLREHLGIEQLAGVRRLVGLDARPRLRANASAASHGAGAARHLHAVAVRVAAGSTRKARARCSRITSQNYIAAIPPAERSDLIQAFYKRLTSDDRATRVAAARAWSIWEAATSYLHINEENLHKWGEEEFAIAVARIECHYFVNRGFLEIRGPAAAQRDTAAADPGRDRAGSLRRGVPDADGLGAASRLAGSGAAHRARRRTLGVRGRQHARADQGDRQVPVGRPPSSMIRCASSQRRASSASCSNHACAEPRRNV